MYKNMSLKDLATEIEESKRKHIRSERKSAGHFWCDFLFKWKILSFEIDEDTIERNEWTTKLV